MDNSNTIKNLQDRIRRENERHQKEIQALNKQLDYHKKQKQKNDEYEKRKKERLQAAQSFTTNELITTLENLLKDENAD